MITNFLKSHKLLTLLLVSSVPVGVATYKIIPEVINNSKTPKTTINNEERKIDTDGDTLNDYDEKNKYKTNPNKKDTDDDGLNDNIEINLNSNPNNPDTDNDGLLDGKAQYKNNIKIAPTDPNPTTINCKPGVWQKQIEIESTTTIPYYLTDFYQYNPNNKSINKVSVDFSNLQNPQNIISEIKNSTLLKSLSSKLLTFRLDNNGKVLHSQSQQDLYEYIITTAKSKLPTTTYKIFESTLNSQNIKNNLETWQKQFGYNKLFDEVFKIATNGNMRSSQIYFKDQNNTEYVLWIWKGDYLVLGSGAEIGLYKKNNSNKKLTDIEHWDAVNFEIPMTLNLYNYNNENNIETIFNWKPQNKQWWITGFNPNHTNTNASKEILIGSVNLTEHKDMYNSIKEQISNNPMKDFVIFDDNETTLWINWYDK